MVSAAVQPIPATALGTWLSTRPRRWQVMQNLPSRWGKVAPHTDYGCLTLLYQDPIGGLQVQGRDGEPPRYAPVTCGDHIVSRFDASFAYRNQGAAG